MNAAYSGRSPYDDEYDDNKHLAKSPKTDVIGGFPYADTNCTGCRNPLLLENAWMTDGCPCNCELGVNSMNETRWRLLMDLQQMQARALENLLAESTAFTRERCAEVAQDYGHGTDAEAAARKALGKSL